MVKVSGGGVRIGIEAAPELAVMREDWPKKSARPSVPRWAPTILRPTLG